MARLLSRDPRTHPRNSDPESSPYSQTTPKRFQPCNNSKDAFRITCIVRRASKNIIYLNVHVIFQYSRCIHFKLIYRPIRAVLTKMLRSDWSSPRDAFTITVYFLYNETLFIVFDRFSSKIVGLAKNL